MFDSSMTLDITEVLSQYEDYLRTEKVLSERSVKDYLEVFRVIIKKVDLLKNPDYKEINDAVKRIKEEQGFSQATIYKFTICLRGITKWLDRERYTVRNLYPYADWRKPKPHTPKFLTPEVFRKIINDPFLSHQEMTLLHLLWDSAARIGELEQLKQSDFFFDQEFFIDEQNALKCKGHYVRISYEISKGNYSNRNVPITDTTKALLTRQFDLLRARGHSSCIMLGASNQPLTKSGISKVLANIGMRESPLREKMNLSAHQFRHGFGIRMLEAGIPQIVLQKWLGHQSLSMTSHYCNLTSSSSMRIFAKTAA